MNYIALALVIVVIILLWFLYSRYGSVSTTLVAQADLNKVVAPITVTDNIASPNYSYGLWLYVNTWDPNATKNIITNTGCMTVTLDNAAPILYCNVTMSDGKTTQTLKITDNFPIQKWTHIIVSMNTQFVDAYINGKLVKSQRFYSPATNGSNVLIPAAPPSSGIITLGNTTTGFDAAVSGFKRWNGAMDPETAWSTYSSGAAGTDFLSSIYNYFRSINFIKFT